MHFSEISINSLRCIERLNLSLSPGLNLIEGRNGSGKTTFLEALSFVSLGRSLNPTQTRDVIREGCSLVRVGATLDLGVGRRLKVQVTKSKIGTKITLNERLIKSSSDLAQKVPLVAINSEVAGILTSAPHARRVLLDRVMFHVERDYISLWREYRQALNQRNGVLRQSKDRRQAQFWTERLAFLGAKIDVYRKEIVSSLNNHLETSFLDVGMGSFSLLYESGWEGGSLFDQLEGGWLRDLELGYTRVGIHRSDVRLRVGSKNRPRRLSRGQLKVIASEIMLGLAGFMQQKTGIYPIMLVDDIQSELDDIMRATLVDRLLGFGGQKFFTAIGSGSHPEIFKKADMVFHVEHKNL